MADKDNIATSSITAEDIHAMANAARDMSENFRKTNTELSRTVQLISKLSSKKQGMFGNIPLGTSAKDTRKVLKEQQRTIREQTRLAKEQAKLAEATARKKRAQRKADGKASAVDVASQLTDGRAGRIASAFRFGPVIAVLTGILAVGKKLIQTGEKLRQAYENGQKDLASIGVESKNLNTVMGTSVKQQGQIDSTMSTLSTVFGAVGNQLKQGFKKLTTALVKLIPGIDKLETAVSGINRIQAIGQIQSSLVGTGLKYGQAATMSSDIEAAAVAYMQTAFGYTAEEARNNENYAATVQAMQNLVTSGGKYGMFNTDLATAWGFEQGKWNPNVQYTDAFMADLRSQYLAEAMTKYMSKGPDALADMQNRLAKTQKIISTMAGQLFSFDEVETQQAISTADTADAINYFGEEATDALRNEEDWLEEIARKYGLSADQIANIRRILTDTDMTMDDINDMLAAGIRFDDASTSVIMALSTEFGLSSAGIISAFTLYAGNLEAALAKIETLDKTGEELEDWLKDPVLTLEELLQIGPTKPAETYEDYVAPPTLAELLAMNGIGTPDLPHATGSSHTHTTGRGADMLSAYSPYKQTDTYFQALQKAANQSTTPYWYTPSHATGGIGTVRETNATLFENGPEAVIPLSTDLGKTFMADAISAAIGNTNIGGDTVNVTIAGPVFTESERQLNKWATELGDRYNQIKARRGGK